MKKIFSNPVLNEIIKEKSTLCVSVIVPLYKISPERDQNPIRVKNAIEEARNQLKKIQVKDKKQSADIKKINESISELFNKIDFIHNGKGIGIFVSKNISHLVYFPFQVSEKIILSDSFETRDMLYKEHYLAEYFILTLTLNTVRLFKGKDGHHTEVKDNNFPKQFLDDYIYEPPARGSSYSSSLKSTEKDKSVMKLIRLKKIYREVDAFLPGYLTGEIPLIISGVAKCLSSFLEITAHQKKIIAQISGNYSDALKHEFEIRTWKKILQHQRGAENSLLKDLENKFRTKSLVTGIKDVWKNAEEGKGLFLVVEKDFRQPGFQKPNEIKITTHPPHQNNFKVMPDVVDDLIELVLEKNGMVSFVQNGTLKKMNHIALITRY